MTEAIGTTMHRWATDLFPIPRSLTGDGVRQTLAYLKERMPALRIHEVPSGTEAFDWTVPMEWNVDEAYIETPQGQRIADYSDNPLHLVGYSTPVDTTVDRQTLDEHLHSLPDQPTAIPYITSYYERRWGFCLPHRLRQRLPSGDYRVVIRSQLEPGSMTYADCLLPGRSDKEILFSTYICHPTMANNELSGPVMACALAQSLARRPRRQWSYRFVFAPETIGAIYYISRHRQSLKRRTLAAFQLTCCGDNRAVSFLPSRRANTLADRVARHVLEHYAPEHRAYSFLDRGSDERQYCSPGVDLPMVSIMASKYRQYPEYHTSDDDLSLLSPDGLARIFELHQRCIDILEGYCRPQAVHCCEPQLGRRGLYPTLSTRGSGQSVRRIKNLLAYADGDHDLLELADAIDAPADELLETCALLEDRGVLERKGPGFC